MRSLKILSPLALIFFFIISTNAQTVYVTPSGSGQQNGSSWANALPGAQLRATLANASAGTSFWVAAGTYKTNTTARAISFTIPNGVRVYGGFNGTETTLGARNWATNVTTLSGDIGVSGNSSDNTLHVVFFDNVTDTTTRIDGFTITAGQADSMGYFEHSYGGGVLARSNQFSNSFASPRVLNCRIAGNRARIGAGVALATGSSKARVDNCVFEDNEALYNLPGSWTGVGGGLYTEVIGTPLARGLDSTVVSNCLFQNNSAFVGGGMRVNSAGGHSRAQILNCTFRNNTADGPGAIMGVGGGLNITSYDLAGAAIDPVEGSVDVLVQGCRFANNFSELGSALAMDADSTERYRVRIQSCVVDSSKHRSVYLLMHNHASARVVFSNTRFHSDTMLYQGQITPVSMDIRSYNHSVDTVQFVNCLIENTTIATDASLEGKMRTEMTGCTMFFSRARQGTVLSPFLSSAVFGPATITSSLTHRVRNSIFWTNYIPAGSTPGSGIHSVGNNPSKIRLSFQNSFVRGSGGSANWVVMSATDSGSNYGQYPGFIDTASFNLKLGCGAQAINKGSNGLANAAGSSTDVSGLPRIQNGTVDVGAHEVDTNAWPAAASNPLVLNVSGTTASFAVGATPAIPDSVRWTFGDGTQSTQSSPVKTYTAAGTYTVCLRVFTRCGIKDSCRSVTVSGGTSGLPLENTTAPLTVYPNPTRDGVTVANLSSPLQVRLVDALGRTVQVTRISSAHPYMSLSGVSAGTYILVATQPDGQVSTFQIQKQP